jgi:hypothetical protein
LASARAAWLRASGALADADDAAPHRQAGGPG